MPTRNVNLTDERYENASGIAGNKVLDRVRKTLHLRSAQR